MTQIDLADTTLAHLIASQVDRTRKKNSWRTHLARCSAVIRLPSTMKPVSVSIAVLLLAPIASRIMAVDFDKDIAPILKQNCYECHSEARKKEKAGFVFDNKVRLKKDIGPNLIIEPG